MKRIVDSRHVEITKGLFSGDVIEVELYFNPLINEFSFDFSVVYEDGEGNYVHDEISREEADELVNDNVIEDVCNDMISDYIQESSKLYVVYRDYKYT